MGNKKGFCLSQGTSFIFHKLSLKIIQRITTPYYLEIITFFWYEIRSNHRTLHLQELVNTVRKIDLSDITGQRKSIQHKAWTLSNQLNSDWWYGTRRSCQIVSKTIQFSTFALNKQFFFREPTNQLHPSNLNVPSSRRIRPHGMSPLCQNCWSSNDHPQFTGDGGL